MTTIVEDSTGITDQPMLADQADLLTTSSKVSLSMSIVTKPQLIRVQGLLNLFNDDDKAVSIKHLLELLNLRQWPVRHLYKVSRCQDTLIGLVWFDKGLRWSRVLIGENWK